MGYDIKSIRQDFKEKGIFYTTPELANYLKSFLPNDVKEIYDPTCGNGGLLSAFSDDVKKYGQDINKEQVEFAEEHLKNFVGVVGDTLKNPAFMKRKFKYIIANPPFSIKWEPMTDERFKDLPALPPKSKADYAFLAHILYLLDIDGMAVVLNFPGILYRGNAEGKIRKWFIENNYIDTVIAIDGGYFVDTKIATAVLILRKNKKETDIKFIHNEREIIVTLDEIRKNDYNLTVSYYIEEEVEKEEINPIELENTARQAFLNKLRKELDFENMVCEMEGISMQPFIDAIKKIIRGYERRNKAETANDNQITIFDYQESRSAEYLKVLVACEESQRVCIEFRRLGHEAYSCDIEPCSGGHEEWHIQNDVLPLLNGNCKFQTVDGAAHKIDGKWDMIIAFPPCTHLAISGARYFEQKQKDGRQKQGIDFFMQFVNCDCEKVAIENPIGIMSTKYRKTDQIIQPYEHGHAERKSTCLWLKGLPVLVPTDIVQPELHICGNGVVDSKWHYETYNLPPKIRTKMRSKTFPGIAKAMAEQWGGCKG